jgi:hypothetical protein
VQIESGNAVLILFLIFWNSLLANGAKSSQSQIVPQDMTHPNRHKETPNTFVMLADIAVTIPSQPYARRAHKGLI